MKTVVAVNDVYKSFGKSDTPWWKKYISIRNTNNGNGSNGSKGSAKPAADSVVDGKPEAKKPNGQNGNGKSSSLPKITVAVNHISLDVFEGEIFGVLGPNGSGKSTLIRLMSTLLLPDTGSISVFGHDVVKESLKVQKLINRVSVEASFFKKLSPMENLLYGARLYGMDGRETRKEIVKILTRLGLEEKAITSPMDEMSRGMQQKVAIARALLTKPRVLLLDEPTTGLDPRSKLEVQAVIRELRDDYGVTMILTTHDMAEAEKLCSRIAILDRGDMVALDTPAGLKAMVEQKNGTPVTLEDVFLELTGREYKADEEE